MTRLVKRFDTDDYYSVLKELEEETENGCYGNLYWVKINRSRGDLFSIDEWYEMCDEGCFIDYDGWGDLFDENYELVAGSGLPSNRNKIPFNVKYILWYNK